MCGSSHERDHHLLGPEESPHRTEDWKPTLGISIVWTIIATVMTVGGVLLFAMLYSAIGGDLSAVGAGIGYESTAESTSFEIQLNGLLGVVLATVGVLVVHEGIHALGFWIFGGRPVVGVMVIQKILPALYCSAPGYIFTRAQFSVISLGPLVLISLVGVALMPFIDNWLLLVLPLGVNFGGAVGDIWMFGEILRRPPDTMIEDLKEGLRFHYPADSGGAAQVSALPNRESQG